jgi:hypothetical protein
VNVLLNDYGEDGDTIVIFIAFSQFNNVSHDDSTITYSSDIYFNGIDSVTYVIYDINNGLYSEKGYLVVDIANNNFDSLDISNISAMFYAWGSHFLDAPSYGPGHFYVPKHTRKSTFFSNSFWIGGLDENDGLHLAGERYRQFGADFWIGPVSGNYDSIYDLKWRKVWKLNKSDVDYHRNNWWKEGYEPIEDILTWPGNGDTGNGQQYFIAPFHDYNGDELYNSFNGDCPIIRGDQALFFVFNDARDAHTETYGRPLGIEIRGMAYAFDCPVDSALYHSVFLHYDVLNLSDTTYSNVYLGTFNDIDLGYAWDDYISCDVQRSSIIGYNGDPFDGGTVPNPLHYNDHPPAQAVTLLGGPLMDPDGQDNPKTDDFGYPLCDYSINGIHFEDGIADNERLGMTGAIHTDNSGNPITGDPQIAPDYYWLLRSIWKDGSHLQYGGYGYTGFSVGPECRFMYPGNSDTIHWGIECNSPNPPYNQPGYLWLEETEEHDPFDRRGILSSGPFTFHPGDKQEMDIAFIFARDYENTGNFSAINILKERIDKIFTYFLNDSTPCNGGSFSNLNEAVTEQIRLRIFPNPANSYIRIEGWKDSSSQEYFIYDMTGRRIKEGKPGESPGIIPLDGLHSGLYILVVNSGKTMVSKRFIKY